MNTVLPIITKAEREAHERACKEERAAREAARVAKLNTEAMARALDRALVVGNQADAIEYRVEAALWLREYEAQMALAGAAFARRFPSQQ